MTRLASNSPADAFSDTGLILSLASALPNQRGPLAKRARAIAHRLSEGACDRALRHRAADLLAVLLDATDCDLAGYPEDGLLDGEFDA